MPVQMLVLALDTTTRAGSVALSRDGALLEVLVGDASRTHATRLPGDLLAVLQRQGVGLGDVDLFAVAAGPGSFTGLRIGIATIQGLAFAQQKPVVAISALEALAYSTPGDRLRSSIGAWMDAQRGEVYGELYRVQSPITDGAPTAAELVAIEPAAVGTADAILDQWQPHVAATRGAGLVFLGDGALVYRQAIEARLPESAVIDAVPPLAPAIARLGARRAEAGQAGPPHAIKPVYVRRPDAELARERHRREDEARSGSPQAVEPRTPTHG